MSLLTKSVSVSHTTVVPSTQAPPVWSSLFVHIMYLAGLQCSGFLPRNNGGVAQWLKIWVDAIEPRNLNPWFVPGRLFLYNVD